MGGVPFRDDLSHAGTWFFVVTSPLLALLPDGGTLVQVRAAGLLLRFAGAGALFLCFRRRLPPLLLAAGLAATLLANFTYLLVPSYNSLPFDAGFASLACWIAGAATARRSRAVAWGAGAGALFALAVLSHLPRAVLLGVPLLVLASARRRRDGVTPGLVASSTAYLAAAVAVLGAAVAAVAVYGLLPDLVAGLRFLAASRTLGVGPSARLARFLGGDLPRALGSAAAHGVFWGGALALGLRAGASTGARRRAHVAALAVLLAAYAVLLTLLYLHAGERWHWAYYRIYSGLCWLPLAAYAPLRGALRRLGRSTARAAALLFAMTLPQQAVVALASTQGVAAGIPGLGACLLLLSLLAVAVAARLDAGDRCPATVVAPTPRARWAAGAAAALCLVLAATAGVFHFYPDENPLRAPLATFRDGRLAGLRSTPERVAGWTELVAYLGPRVARGEPLLAYVNAPLVYYATGTRTALGATVVSPLLSAPGQQEALVRRMLARGRAPRYAVRLRKGTADEAVFYSARPDRDPVNAFVRARYRLETRLLLFDVFRRR